LHVDQVPRPVGGKPGYEQEVEVLKELMLSQAEQPGYLVHSCARVSNHIGNHHEETTQSI
jgi:hypothetical protein